MAKSEPLTGPFPDGDSRNLTLVKSDNPIELERTGPQEPGYRREGAPETVMGDLPMHGGENALREPSVVNDELRRDGSSEADSKEERDTATSHETAEPYALGDDTAPSAAQTAFDRPTGDLDAPVLQKDWNPTERNADDLSR